MKKIQLSPSAALQQYFDRYTQGQTSHFKTPNEQQFQSNRCWQAINKILIVKKIILAYSIRGYEIMEPRPYVFPKTRNAMNCNEFKTIYLISHVLKVI